MRDTFFPQMKDRGGSEYIAARMAFVKKGQNL
jgi:hypothetical protein